MRAAEVLASRILLWGGVLSILLMTLGLIGSWAAAGGLGGHPSGTAAPPPGRSGGAWGAPGAPQLPQIYTSVGQVARALARWPVDPLAVVAAGILLLLVTPFASLVAVFIVFAVAGDRRYAGVTALLLAALLLSLLFVGAK